MTHEGAWLKISDGKVDHIDWDVAEEIAEMYRGHEGPAPLAAFLAVVCLSIREHVLSVKVPEIGTQKANPKTPS